MIYHDYGVNIIPEAIINQHGVTSTHIWPGTANVRASHWQKASVVQAVHSHFVVFCRMKPIEEKKTTPK